MNVVMPTPMSPAAFRAALAAAGLTLIEAAKRLGVNARTVRRWCQDPDDAGYRDIRPEQQMRIDLMLQQTRPRKKAKKKKKGRATARAR